MADVFVKTEDGSVVQLPANSPEVRSGYYKLASKEDVAVDQAEKADLRKFEADPKAYAAEARAKDQAEMEAIEKSANDAMGGPFQKALLGAASDMVLGPNGMMRGLGPIRGLTRGSAIVGSAISGQMPTSETFTRANLGAIGLIPGAEAVMGGMFGKENMLAIKEGSGYTSGKVGGTAALAYGGPAALLGRGASLARIAAVEGLEGAIMNANDEATQQYLNNEPLSASKILMAAGTGATISALPVVGIASGRAIGRYFRNAGALNEAKLGISGIDAEVRQAYRAKGLDYDDFAKRAGLPNVTSPQDLPSVAAKLTDDAADLGKRISSLEAKIPKATAPVTVAEAAEDYVNVASHAMPGFRPPVAGQTFAEVAAAAGQAEIAAVKSTYSAKFVPDPDNFGRTVLGTSKEGKRAIKAAEEAVQMNVDSLLGGAKMLDKIQEVGGVTGQNIGDLRKFASKLKGKYEPGAQRVLNSAQRKFPDRVMELDPKLANELKELTERKAATDFAASRYRDAAAKGSATSTSPWASSGR